MIVIIEAREFEALGVAAREHAKRHAGFQPERFHAANHRAKPIEVALLGASPGRSHAISGRARRLRLLASAMTRSTSMSFEAEPGAVMGGLAAIAAVLRAAARLNAQKPAHLHFVWIEMAAVDSLGLEEKTR